VLLKLASMVEERLAEESLLEGYEKKLEKC
jgi:hypothetical protein